MRIVHFRECISRVLVREGYRIRWISFEGSDQSADEDDAKGRSTTTVTLLGTVDGHKVLRGFTLKKSLCYEPPGNSAHIPLKEKGNSSQLPLDGILEVFGRADVHRQTWTLVVDLYERTHGR